MTEESPLIYVCYPCLAKAGATHLFVMQKGAWHMDNCDVCGEMKSLAQVERERYYAWRKEREEQHANPRAVSNSSVSDGGGAGQ